MAGIMKEERDIDPVPIPRFESVGFGKIEPEIVFVAFIDILGFGQNVLSDFDAARQDYSK